ncbi:ankyrin repeat-containing domain protein [Apiospora hydei]|uniref:Ankyrin repeat-containing domain protein n=1 Tax=Apiospora hydei TaxID=1337664 RepID=A0ABR1WX63_9PEZI
MVKWIIRQTKNVDACDHEGIRPLHVASMLSEDLVHQLLAAGADPAGATLEGLTSLHLAARARESNIVGMLIDALDASKTTSTGEQQRHLDARDQLGRTPLHHACRSGRYETVSLLLSAGADPTLKDNQGLTVLDACTEFEKEQALWADWRKPDLFDSEWLWKTAIPRTWDEYAVGGLKLHDSLRPWVAPGRTLTKYLEETFESHWKRALSIRSAQDVTRLEDIIALLYDALLKRGEADGSRSVEAQMAICLERCKSKRFAYTERVFRHQLFIGTGNKGQPSSMPSDNELSESLRRRVAEFANEQRGCVPGSHIGFDVVEYLLRRREHDILQRMFQQGGPPFPVLAEEEVGRVARLLAQHGFAQLLATLLESDYYGPKVTKSCSHAQHEGRRGVGGSADPILVVAARRELPNMDVMRLLVGKKDVTGKTMNLNAKSRSGQAFFDAEIDHPGLFWSEENEIEPGNNTALHEFAKGRHWWHVTQGLPYLLAAGADPSQQNEAKQTPLKMAEAMLLRYGGEEPFTARAVEVLRREARSPKVPE